MADGLMEGEGKRLVLRPGVWGLLATPFTADSAAVDFESLTRLASYYLSLDLAGLTVLGVFGEAADLTPAERRDVVGMIHGLSPGTPLVVGVTSRSTDEAIDEIRNVADAGGTAIASYLVQVNAPTAPAVVAHLRQIHKATGARVVIQDYPAVSGVSISTEELLVVVRQCPFVTGIKLESAPTPPKVAALTSGCSVPVLGGLGATYLLDELACGAAGAMTGFSAPEGLIKCCAAYRSGGFAAAREVWLPYLPLVNFEFQAGIAKVIRKEGLRLRGLIDHASSRTGGVDLAPEMLALLQRHMTSTP